MSRQVEPIEFLRAYGYLRPDDADPAPAIERYQRVHALPVTGEVDAGTEQMMARPRCGVPDVAAAATALGVGDAWPRRELTYSFQEITAQLGAESLATNAITEALRLWSEVLPLTFRQVWQDDESDLVVRFVVGAHGDGLPFDGPGRVLAHAFYPPPNGGAIAGDAHFDDTERWAVDMPVDAPEVDLVTVAAHEFGHSLGLDHSADPEAIMFPVILGTRRYLGGDDVARIQALYGAPNLGDAVAVAGGGTPALVYTAPDRLELFLANALGGRRRRRFAGGRWEQWEELGGEREFAASLNLVAVPLADDGPVALFSLDPQRRVRSLVVDDGGPSTRSSRSVVRAAPFLAAGDADGAAVYVTAPKDPEAAIDDPDLPTGALFESRLVDGRLTGWTLVEPDASSTAALAANPAGPSALIVADHAGRPKVADGRAGAWGSFQGIDDGRRIDPRAPFWPIRGCFSGGVLHVVMVDAEFRLLHRRRIGATWTPWEDLGGPWTRSELVESGSGRVHVLSTQRIGPAAIATFDGAWGEWSSFEGERKVVAAAATTGRVDVILREPQRLLHVTRHFS